MNNASTDLVSALRVLVEHYENGTRETDDVTHAKLIVAHDVTSFAMWHLLDTIARDGYVRPERSKELQQRARNILDGRGFLTDDEIEAKALLED